MLQKGILRLHTVIKALEAANDAVMPGSLDLEA